MAREEVFVETEQCKDCLFNGLCRASQIEHCEGDCYVKEVERV